MKQRRSVLVAVALFAMSLAVHAQTAQAPKTIDYDTFFKLDVPARIRAFNEITAENRAELVKTQIQRWMDQNRARLTADQVKLLEEAMTITVADNYRGPMTDELRAKLQSLEKRMAAVFTQEDLAAFMTNAGPYIPKKGGK